MKISKTFTVTIDDAEFDFREISQKEVFENQTLAKGDAHASLDFVLSRLIAVRHVEDDDGPVSPERLRDLTLPFSFVQKLVRKFWDSVTERAGLKGADSKNVQ